MELWPRHNAALQWSTYLSNDRHDIQWEHQTLRLRSASPITGRSASISMYRPRNQPPSPAQSRSRVGRKMTTAPWDQSTIRWMGHNCSEVYSVPRISEDIGPDVCAVYAKSPDCPNVGWSARLDTTQLANGTHTLTVTATSQFYRPEGSPFSTQDTLASAPVTFTVNNTITSQSTHVDIDRPTASEVLWHQATISGWAVDDNTAINSIEIAVDGQTVGSINPFFSSPSAGPMSVPFIRTVPAAPTWVGRLL